MTRGATRARDILAYGLPNTVAALPIIPIAVLLPSWYLDNTGLGTLAIGIGLGLARLGDFFTDAIVGVLVDRSQGSKWRYKPWIAAGTIIACCALFALATPPADVNVIYLGVWAALLFTGWTMIMVPYTAWGAELASAHHDRSRLAASREVAGVVGMLAALSLPLLIHSTGNPLLLVAAAAAGLALPALGICFWSLPDVPANALTGRQGSWADMGGLLHQPSIRRMTLYWLVNSTANAVPAVLFPLVVTHYFGLKDEQLYLLLLTYFGSAVVLAPIWVGCANRIGKLGAWRVALSLSVLAFLPVVALEQHQSAWFYVVCVLTGGTLAADLALPPSIQADALEYDRRTNNRRRSGAAFALWSMATKLAFALAIVGAFGGLYLVGADPAAGLGADESNALLLLYVAIPVLLKVAVIVLSRQPLAELELQRESTPYPAA
ncbi:MAG: MFS transporter [Gammaproteobacteria bacterium]